MRSAVSLAALVAVAWMVKGCTMNAKQVPPPEPAASTGQLLLDAERGTTSRVHCFTVDDPFGGRGKVVHGEVVEEGKNKTTFLNSRGFFVVPPEGAGKVVLRYAVRKERSLRVALVGERGNLKSYYFQAPAENTWCEAVMPLKDLAGKVNAGEKVVDISVWQQGGGKDAGLWVDRITLHLD
jgi:hypothetical protein